ncbi:glycosyltransferase family 4 protein [Bacteroides sp. 224]|uniref:glycosyltransferase family 4 protein n=1 Tax=Bacteroides sp. 224 TaxID=2302936 RepID=UPI0013D2FEEA|nr:glycosyltransferase [Bacteroides sp. 224]NDV66985.1 glycosyltransferase family 1 protein [Bacteroides sp. 224]
MKIVFFSNFLNHHQVAVSDKLFQLTEGKYRFIATMPIPETLKKSGYPDFSSKPYIIKTYNNHYEYQLAEELAKKADVAIFGWVGLEHFEKIRARTKKITFQCNERWLKRGLTNIFSPNFQKWLWNYHLNLRYGSFYMLCASAYASSDLRTFAAYNNRCYKWGYFPQTENVDIQNILLKKQKEPFSILWVGRFLNWKHPEIPVKMAKFLHLKGYNFTVNMYGSGKLLEKTKDMINKEGLSDVISLRGNLPNKDLLLEIQKHHILLITSDRNEGWGAIVNEAMNNGCTVVGAEAVGSIPYLIKNKENGCIFRTRDVQSLINNVEYLMKHRDVCEEYARKAYTTIRELWGPQTAAENLLQLIDCLTSGQETTIMEGPCSKAIP